MDEDASPPRSAVTDACRRIERHLAVIDARRRQGLPVDGEEAVLREMRIGLGLAYAQEAIRLAEARQGWRAREQGGRARETARA
ncbi:hypothetical protein OPKNFCMD_3631 [Methylobacterium crusticola]|uniref:Uncharacterized protein n=1 Tax=Methylobacterium crusticola TaxID=1697972 RepID=A0ABQ4R031_9HYPH|nr:hypothetical protein [Methylobacterium crusticola]GJD50883.1 hypothetical protein OPKNFCMD_3631 [Methylobacterium crusticola]